MGAPTPSAEPVLLGTVALEPNRWGTVTGRREPTMALSAWLDGIHAAGFDGVEVWEPHLADVPDAEAALVLAHALPVGILSSYASLDDADAVARSTAWAVRSGCRAVKFNAGSDGSGLGLDAERAAAWLDRLPASVALLCKCHDGTAAADDHAATARFLAAAGPPDRVQAIVHTHEAPDRLAARFAAYGDRIRHVHVNHLDAGLAPPLSSVTDLAARVATIRAHGFDGSWTLEFVHGTLTDLDHPERLLAQAVVDLTVLRSVLA